MARPQAHTHPRLRLRIPFSALLVAAIVITLILDASIVGRPGLLRAVAYLFIAVGLVIAYESLPRRRKARHRARRRRRGQCEECGYDLRYATHPRCPECGVAASSRSS